MTNSSGIPALKNGATTAISQHDDVMSMWDEPIVSTPMVKAWYGVNSVQLPRAGYFGQGGNITGFRAAAVSTDGLKAVTDANGNIIPGSGLMFDDHRRSEEYDCYALFNRTIYDRRIVTAFTHDDHTAPEQINPDFVTQYRLDNEQLDIMQAFYDKAMNAYNRAVGKARQAGTDISSIPVPVNHAELVRNDAELASLVNTGTRLTVAQLVKLFGADVLRDGEFRDFLFNFDHCVSGRFEPVESVAEIRNMERARIKQHVDQYGTVPSTYFFPAGKKFLSGDIPPDELGLGSNGLSTWLKAARARRPLGTQYHMDNWIVVGGAVLGITVEEIARYVVQRGFRVLVLLSAVEALPGLSKPMQILKVRESFPKGIMYQYAWPASLLGPEPAGYNAQAKRVWEKDRDNHLNSPFGAIGNTLMTGVGEIKLINDWEWKA